MSLHLAAKLPYRLLVSFWFGLLAAKIPKLHDIQQSLKDSVAMVASLLNSTSIQVAPDLANCLPDSQFLFRWWLIQHDSRTISHWSAKLGSRASSDSAVKANRFRLECLSISASLVLNLQLNLGFSRARSFPTWQHLSINLLWIVSVEKQGES